MPDIQTVVVVALLLGFSCQAIMVKALSTLGSRSPNVVSGGVSCR
jgi:hypothetical protein